MLNKLSNIIEKFLSLFAPFAHFFFAGDRARGEIRMTDSSTCTIFVLLENNHLLSNMQ